MPKMPNSEIRIFLGHAARTIRECCDDIDKGLDVSENTRSIRVFSYIVDEMVEKLHNSKPLKPRAKNKSPRVTKAMGKAIKTMAAMGMANDQIAAQFNINQGRVTDALNGKYDR